MLLTRLTEVCARDASAVTSSRAKTAASAQAVARRAEGRNREGDGPPAERGSRLSAWAPLNLVGLSGCRVVGLSGCRVVGLSLSHASTNRKNRRRAVRFANPEHRSPLQPSPEQAGLPHRNRLEIGHSDKLYVTNTENSIYPAMTGRAIAFEDFASGAHGRDSTGFRGVRRDRDPDRRPAALRPLILSSAGLRPAKGGAYRRTDPGWKHPLDTRLAPLLGMRENRRGGRPKRCVNPVGSGSGAPQQGRRRCSQTVSEQRPRQQPALSLPKGARIEGRRRQGTPFDFIIHERFPVFLNFVPDMGLTSGGLWYDGPRGSGLRSRFPGAPRGRAAPFLKTREKPTGDVRPPPRARNQVREPRRRETRARADTGARAGYARKRDPLPVGAGETMTATDPQSAAMLADGGAPPRRPHKAPAQRPGRRFTPRRHPGRRGAPIWDLGRPGPEPGEEIDKRDGFMPEQATAYEPRTCGT